MSVSTKPVLTAKDWLVLRKMVELTNGRGIPPAQVMLHPVRVGEELGYKHRSASACVCGSIKRLLKQGLVEPYNCYNSRNLGYHLTESGLFWAEHF